MIRRPGRPLPVRCEHYRSDARTAVRLKCQLTSASESSGTFVYPFSFSSDCKVGSENIVRIGAPLLELPDYRGRLDFDSKVVLLHAESIC